MVLTFLLFRFLENKRRIFRPKFAIFFILKKNFAFYEHNDEYNGLNEIVFSIIHIIWIIKHEMVEWRLNESE